MRQSRFAIVSACAIILSAAFAAAQDGWIWPRQGENHLADSSEGFSWHQLAQSHANRNSKADQKSPANLQDGITGNRSSQEYYNLPWQEFVKQSGVSSQSAGPAERSGSLSEGSSSLSEIWRQNTLPANERRSSGGEIFPSGAAMTGHLPWNSLVPSTDSRLPSSADSPPISSAASESRNLSAIWLRQTSSPPPREALPENIIRTSNSSNQPADASIWNSWIHQASTNRQSAAVSSPSADSSVVSSHFQSGNASSTTVDEGHGDFHLAELPARLGAEPAVEVPEVSNRVEASGPWEVQDNQTASVAEHPARTVSHAATERAADSTCEGRPATPLRENVFPTNIATAQPVPPLTADSIAVLEESDPIRTDPILNSMEMAVEPLISSVNPATPFHLLNLQTESASHTELAAQQRSLDSDVPPAQLPAEELGLIVTDFPPYVLQDLRTMAAITTQQDGVVEPIDVLPIDRLFSSQSVSAIGGTYDVASMIGPMADPAKLFANLRIDEEFRTQAVLSTDAVRVDKDAAGYGFAWSGQDYAWVNPTIYHNPLYFEQVNLERYGIGARRYLQPVYSAAHFFGTVGLMPYKLLTQHPCEKVYTLGHQRPGDCVKYQGRSLLGQSYPGETLKYFRDFAGYR